MAKILRVGQAGALATQRINGATAQKTVSGTVVEGSTAVDRIVLVFNRNTYELVGKTVSSAVDGSYSVVLNGYTGAVFVVALDDPAGNDYNAMIFDGVVGV
jgi:hypothetical protein